MLHVVTDGYHGYQSVVNVLYLVSGSQRKADTGTVLLLSSSGIVTEILRSKKKGNLLVLKI